MMKKFKYVLISDRYWNIRKIGGYKRQRNLGEIPQKIGGNRSIADSFDFGFGIWDFGFRIAESRNCGNFTTELHQPSLKLWRGTRIDTENNYLFAEGERLFLWVSVKDPWLKIKLRQHPF